MRSASPAPLTPATRLAPRHPVAPRPAPGFTRTLSRTAAPSQRPPALAAATPPGSDPPPPPMDADEALLMEDLRRLSSSGGASGRGPRPPMADRSSAPAPTPSSSSSSGAKDLLDKALVADFFFVLAALAWLVAGVGVRVGGGSTVRRERERIAKAARPQPHPLHPSSLTLPPVPLPLSLFTPPQAILDAWYGLWPLVFQPAIGALMAGAVSRSKQEKREGEGGRGACSFPIHSTHSLSLFPSPPPSFHTAHLRRPGLAARQAGGVKSETGTVKEGHTLIFNKDGTHTLNPLSHHHHHHSHLARAGKHAHTPRSHIISPARR